MKSNKGHIRILKLLFGTALPTRIWEYLYPGQAKPGRIFQDLTSIPYIMDEIDRKKALDKDPWVPHRRTLPTAWPDLDISVVTYNSSKWISGFVESLIEQNYPTHKLTLLIADNSPDWHLCPKNFSGGFPDGAHRLGDCREQGCIQALQLHQLVDPFPFFKVVEVTGGASIGRISDMDPAAA